MTRGMDLPDESPLYEDTEECADEGGHNQGEPEAVRPLDDLIADLKAPIMYMEAWAKFRISIMLITSVSPEATRKRSMPYTKPCKNNTGMIVLS